MFVHNTLIPWGFTGEEQNETNDILRQRYEPSPAECLDVCSVDLQYH